jgi:hypothetical protein
VKEKDRERGRERRATSTYQGKKRLNVIIPSPGDMV